MKCKKSISKIALEIGEKASAKGAFKTECKEIYLEEMNTPDGKVFSCGNCGRVFSRLLKTDTNKNETALSQWKAFLEGQGVEWEERRNEYGTQIELSFKSLGDCFVYFNPDGSLYKE